MASMDSFSGPWLIGSALSTFLLGMTTVQLRFYFRHFPEDPRRLKMLTATVWLLDVAHHICCVQLVYWVLIINFGNPSIKILGSPPPKVFPASLILSAPPSAIAQGFFVFRFWRTTKRTLLLVLLVCLVAARFCLTMALGKYAYTTSSFAAYFADYERLLSTNWVCGAVTDVLITLSLTYELHNRRSGIHRTSKLIDRLIMWVVTTGMVTTIAAILETSCFLAMKDNLIWITFHLLVPRLFAISMISSLNSRKVLRRFDAEAVHITNTHLEAPTQSESDKELQTPSELTLRTKDMHSFLVAKTS